MVRTWRGKTEWDRGTQVHSRGCEEGLLVTEAPASWGALLPLEKK